MTFTPHETRINSFIVERSIVKRDHYTVHYDNRVFLGTYPSQETAIGIAILMQNARFRLGRDKGMQFGERFELCDLDDNLRQYAQGYIKDAVAL